MKQSTFSAVMANSIKNLLQGYTKGIRFVAVLMLLLTIGIGQAWGADTWTLVKDVSELAAGDEVVIAASGSNYALGTTQNNNNRAAVSITKSGDNITWTTAVQVLTLKEGTVSGTFAFYTGSGYLYAASSSSNHLKTQTTNNANGSWKITITSAGVASITAQGTNTKNQLKKNSSSALFSCYSSGQSTVAIYKKQAACSYNINYTTNNKADNAGGTWSENNCFEQEGSTTEWRYEMTLPGGGGSFWVGNGAWVNNKSEVQSLSTITFVGLQGTSCGKPYPGEGAVGYVRIYSNSGDKNYYAAFQPTYQLALGIEGSTWQHKPFALVSGNKYETDLIELPADFSDTYKYYVGPKKSDNTTIWVNGKSSTDAVNTMGGMSSPADLKSAKGKFRMYDNSCDNNWYCSFIPYYNYKLLKDDGSVFYASDYVSSEAANKATTIYSSTPTKTGHTFVGWSRTKNATTADVKAGDSYNYWKANDTFYPVWKANTYQITSTLTGCSINPVTPYDYTYTGSAANLTFTITPNSGYQLPTSVTVSGSTYTWDNETGKLTLIGTIKSDVAITVTAIQFVDILWYVNGKPWNDKGGSSSIEKNKTYDDLTLPKAPEGSELEACYDDKVFVGWSTTDVGHVETNTKPTLLAEALTTPITVNTTFYAVFATGTGGGTSTVSLLSEDFSSIQSGDNTSTSGSSTAWTKNNNFYSVSAAYQAGGAVKLGTGSAIGYLVTKQLTAAIGDKLTISFKVKGWSSVEGDIQVSGNNSEFAQPSAIKYSSTMSGSFESKSVTVTLTKANPYIKIATTAKRAFIDDIVITKTTTASPDYSGYVSKCYCVTGIVLSMTGGHQNLDVGQTNQLSVEYIPENATCDKEIVSWTSSNNNILSVSNTGLVTANMAGEATITATTEGGVTATYTITVNNPDCEAWYIHYWNNSTSGDECFYKVKPDDPNDHEWRTGNFSLPSFSNEDMFIVNNAQAAGGDSQKIDQIFRTGIGFADIQRGGQNCGTNPYPGQDAYGQLSIYDDSNSPNRYIAFYPAQYMVTFGKGDSSWEEMPLNNTTGYEYESEPFMVPNGYKTDNTYKYYVGITDKNGNIKYVGYEFGGVEYKKSSVDAMNTVNGLSTSDMAGKWGVWHIWSNSCANNWYAEFIRYYRVDFNLNGGEGDIAPRYGKAAEPYATFSTTDITAPTRDGHTFLGWKDQKENSYNPTESTVTINDDLTLTAQWAKHHTVAYDANGGTTRCEDDNIYIEGDEVKVCADQPTRTGYTFDGWIRSDNGARVKEGESFTMPDEDVTLTAQWIINKYIVTLNPNYPAGKTGTFTYEEGELVDGNLVLKFDYNTDSKTITDLYTSLTLDGYELGGWYNAKGSNPGQVSGSKCTTTGTITGNKTYYAQWTPTYTITWLANGQEFHKQENAVEGTALDLPDSEPDAETYACDDKVFVGWTATPISGTKDDEPADLFTTKTAKVEDAATTFYAVFATAEGGGTENAEATLSFESTAQRTTFTTSQQVWTQNGITLTNNKASSTSNVGDYSNPARFYKSSDITITAPGNITQIVFTCNTEAYATSLATSIGDSDFASGTIVSLILGGTSDSYEVTLSDGQVRMNSLTVTYTTGNGTSYSDYTTVCEAIPDPVWGGAVINRNSIKVDCGSMTKLNAADPNGPATISFPAATNHTLTYDITVTASEGFLVSTNKTDAAKYGASVTVSPNKTGDNAGNITQNVYVVAVAPAMSDEDFTGTITLSGKQLAENQVIDVTADVTCTTYTLTLNDRGTKTTAEYYAGASVPKPADPEGVCTDPINYVFDGWSVDPVTDENTTSYEKVTFPFDMPAEKKTLYAVYRYVEEGSADSGDYVKLTEDLDDYSGDYLIVYEAGKVAFDGGLDELDGTENTINVTINSNTVESNATTDAAKFTIAKVDGGYSIQSASGYYIGWGGEKNGLNTNSSYTVNYLNTITDKSTICGKTGYLKFNKTSGQERFRYYKSGQETIALYRKAASYLYTTSPVCGPHLVITEGKEIYVTGGNAGGTRDLVIAQQKVSYKATRLNVGPTSQVPDVKVATNGITVGGGVTSDVKVTIDQTKEQQTDGTYTIIGTITVQYQPSANNKQEDIQVQLAVDYNAEARDNFIVHARSLPSEFVIVAKSGDKWYALNGDMNTNAANPANGQVTLDNDANPTKATYAPCNTIYTFDGVPNTGDRTYVRFQGTDGAWLWAASGTNVGIQNNVLKTTPEGSNKAYNWKLYTEDNITYRFGNANNSRQLTLSGEKFGMYASGVQDIRILPYVEKCLYNYAPTNLKVSVLKGTYVTLTWDAVAGATKYQYSTNGTTWTDAGTEPTVTINGLTGDTEYIYYIRAYHEDAGVSQECIDYAEITFTTADCDDVPTNITYTADLNSITVSWTAAAPTATIKLFMNEDGTGGGGTYPGATSPYRISGGLDKNTTYYIQILSDGTCASPIIPVKTEDVELDIVEWKTDGIVVDINTHETVGVTLENEVSYGTGLGTEATELFFSKYYEATGNVKLVAVYNGTKNIIDLTNYTIQYGKTSWESNYITLKDFGTIKGQIQPGEEIILYSMQEKNAEDDKEIMDCVHEQYPDGAWVKVTASNNEGGGNLQFGGDKTIILCETRYDETDGEYYDYILDVIGALTDDFLPDPSATEEPSWGDKEGWVCQTGLSIADDSQIGISTNRCLLIRNNTVTSGENAVASNINDFVTLCTEWKGAQVPDNDIDNGVAASCENFAYVGTFDYSDYYTKYVPMDGGTSTFDENNRNSDGTVSIDIPDLYKRACSNIRVKLTNSDGEVLTDREYKVPIMITSDQTTAGQAFLDLQENLATVEVDDQGNVIKTYPLTLDEVREICKTCDVVIRDNATLTKVTDGTENDHPQVNNVIIYEGASLEIPSGADYNYTINSLSLRRKGDIVASAKVEEGGKLHLPASATAPIYLDMRIDANNWHWFTLPYNCNIADVTWVDGTPAQYNKDWFIMYYDGNSRANEQSIYENHWRVYNGTTIEAGKGYIVGIQGDITHPNHTFELRFPMATEVLTNEHVDKTVAVNAWGVNMDITPNKKGWNLVGNPYLDYYKTSENISFKGLSLIKYEGIDPVTGDRLYDDSGTSPFLVTPVDGGWYEYQQELASDVEMMPFTAYFVQVGDPANASHTDGMELHAKFVSDNRGRMSLIRRAPQEVDGEQEPVIVRVEVANAKGESDKTTLIIDDRFTNEYEMNGDFFKWFGDYYRRYTKPVLYSMGADQGKRAFNALSEQLAAQPIPLGMFAAQAGDYTFTLTRKRCDLSRVEEVWLYDATTATYTNLMQQDYTFTTAKTEGEGRFYLSVKMRQNAPTDITDIYGGNIVATAKDGQIIVGGLTDNTQLWIYDATGKLLHTEQTTNFQHVYKVPVVGTYFVRTQVAGQSQTIKVLVE